MESEVTESRSGRGPGWKWVVFPLVMVLLIVGMIVLEHGFLSPSGTWFGGGDVILSTPAERGMAFNILSVKAEDESELSVWYIPRQEPEEDEGESFFYYLMTRETPKRKPGGTVIVVGDGAHHKGEYLAQAKALYECGYTIYLFDFRGCGESAGEPGLDKALADTVTMAREVLRHHPGERLALYGLGVGCNLALEAAYRLEKAEPGTIRALVLDTPVRSLRQYHRERLEARYGRWLAPLVAKRQRLGIEVRSLKDALLELRPVPMFFMHGEFDEASLMDTARMYVYKKGPKDFWRVPDSRVGEGARQFPLETRFQLGRFLDPYLLKKGVFEPDFKVRISKVEEGGYQVLFEALPRVFAGKDQDGSVAVEVCLIGERSGGIDRQWLSRTPGHLVYHVEEQPLLALARCLRYVEPRTTLVEGRERTDFVLSRSDSRRQYECRNLDLAGERVRLTQLYEVARGDLTTGSDPNATEWLKQAKVHLSACRDLGARRTLMRCLQECAEPCAILSPGGLPEAGGIACLSGERAPVGGAACPVEIQGHQALSTRVESGGDRLYFDVDDGIVMNLRPELVGIEIEYLDAGRDQFCLCYDSHDVNAPDVGGDCKPTRMVFKGDSGDWQKTLFVLSDARFANRGPGGSDFCLSAVDGAAYPQDEVIKGIRLFLYQRR